MARKTLLVFAIVALIITFAVAQTKIKQTPAPYTSAASGQEMYKAYCASCHGLDGKGTGPAASAMKHALPDLTMLAKKNGGKFPSNHVAAVISGDYNSPSHGSQSMPVWGPVFLKVSQHQPAEVLQRISNLTKHIESMQTK